MSDLHIDPSKIKGSDGTYLTFTEDAVEKEQDATMQSVAKVVAIFISVCVVAVLAAGTVKFIMWMF